jgi:hypothetical protein
VVVIATAIVAVVSIVKVTKLKNYTRDLEQNLIDNSRMNNIEHSRVWQQFESTEQAFNSQLDSRLDKLNNKQERSIEDLHKVFNDYINNKRVK